ncbi:MAG: signal peptidase I [Cyanobacteria bacterium]|nr:signal peptidase I [Cyanobacteriota bacterium]PHX87992.1 MAG: signal peptidase I [Synechococcus sp. Baikal-G1]
MAAAPPDPADQAAAAPASVPPIPSAAKPWWASFLLWLALALLLRWAVVEPRWIPSGSMLPTLELQDRVLVEKVRPKVGQPLPLGTIVVFHPPEALLAAGYDPKAALIKRVVGRSGDVVEVKGGQLYRNGEAVVEPWLAEPMLYRFGPVTVPTGNLLVLGDNRNASLDSHLWGPLPSREVIGTALVRYWPWNRIGLLRFSAKAPPAQA